MKRITSLILTAAVLLLACALPAKAQQYGIAATFTQWGATNPVNNLFGITNATTTATNLSFIGTNSSSACTNGIALTKWGDVWLNFDLGFDAALAGDAIAITLETSADGSNWNTNKTIQGGGLPAWFKPGNTNVGTRLVWGTNVTVNSLGYLRFGWMTNVSGANMTNCIIRAYTKPIRFGS